MSSTSMNHPLSIRPTAVAGSFYPKHASELNNMLKKLLSLDSVKVATPKAIIAPHAGYIYSGQTAASVYSNIEQVKDKIRRVVLLGPTHRVYVKGIALPSNTHFASPLGNVSIDTQSLKKSAHIPLLITLMKHMCRNTVLKCTFLFYKKS